MHKRNNIYYVPIDSDFLFDNNRVFKSRYTPWIYIYLKLDNLYYLQHAPYKTIKLKTKEIGKFFKIDRATVHRSINQLIEQGLIEKKEKDTYILNAERIEYYEESGNPYLLIFNNLFIDIFLNGGDADDATVYYFMILDNRHYAFDCTDLESNLNQTKISKALNFDSRKTKAILARLYSLGLITFNDKSKKYRTKYSKKGTVKVEKRLDTKSDGIEDTKNEEGKVPNFGLFNEKRGDGRKPTLQNLKDEKMTPGNRGSRISTNNIRQNALESIEYANSYS